MSTKAMIRTIIYTLSLVGLGFTAVVVSADIGSMSIGSIATLFGVLLGYELQGVE